MTTTLHSWEWRFGGVLADMSAAHAWILLLVLLCAAASSVWLSYRKPRAPLSLFQRAILVFLRCAILLGLLLCLANPARVTREVIPPLPKKPLAVMLDRSGSMTTQDNRGRSRLQDALRTWQRLESATHELFSKIQYFRFASSATPADSLDAALRHPEPPDQTRLAVSFKEVFDSAPPQGLSGILCITDGLDTTGGTLDEAVKLSLATRTPLYFLPSRNRLQPKQLLFIREFNTPSRAMTRTEFSVSTVIESYSSASRSIPITLREGDRIIAQTSLQADAGFGSYPWTVSVPAQVTAGKMNLTLTIGTRGEEKTGRAEVKVLDRVGINVLVYQGTLDWGFRFMCNAISRDPNFRLTGLIDPSTNVRVSIGPKNVPPLAELPKTTAQLANYNIIVLANAVAENLSPEQQQALVAYVRDGGGILFIESDTVLGQRFSGSALEEMLPVRFNAPEPVNLHGEAESRFREEMRQTRWGSTAGQETNFAAGAVQRDTQPRLKKFGISAPTKLATVLSNPNSGKPGAMLEPMFSTFARVKSAKPGAQILAIHPTEKDPASGEPAILMASQVFGNGRATVLTTDSLWRWKLSMESKSRDVETFWQQLFVWLAQPSLEGLRFVKPRIEITAGKPAKFVLAGCRGGTAPTVNASLNATTTEILPVQPGIGDTYEIPWTPKKPGRWTLKASDISGGETIASVEVVEPQATMEMANIPPDLELMRRVAESTGGELLQNGIPASWKQLAATPQSQVISEKSTLLWNQWLFLLACLGLYSVELVLRRFWKLI